MVTATITITMRAVVGMAVTVAAPKITLTAKKCKCMDCTYEAKGDACIKDMKKSCGAPKFKGDKYCDDSNNFAGCQWDGGDCCGPANNYKYCKECQCRDCTSKHKKTCPVLLVAAFEFLEEVVDHPVVEVFAAKMRVAR